MGMRRTVRSEDEVLDASSSRRLLIAASARLTHRGLPCAPPVLNGRVSSRELEGDGPA